MSGDVISRTSDVAGRLGQVNEVPGQPTDGDDNLVDREWQDDNISIASESSIDSEVVGVPREVPVIPVNPVEVPVPVRQRRRQADNMLGPVPEGLQRLRPRR